MNLTKRIAMPHSLGTQRCPLRIPPSGKTPWLKTEVIIVSRHPLRTRRGIITNVLCKQATDSGLRVEILLSCVDVFLPFRTIILDYDAVIEVKYVTMNQLDHS